MSYDYVVNPYTNRRVSIYSQTGQNVLNDYLEHLGGGGACAGHKNVKKCPSGCKKATYTYKKARGSHKRGDSYTYCTPEHRAHKKAAAKKAHKKQRKQHHDAHHDEHHDDHHAQHHDAHHDEHHDEHHDQHQQVRKRGRKKRGSRGSRGRGSRGSRGKQQQKHRSPSPAPRRRGYDALDRHETRRKPGRRGDHEGLASLGYGGSPKASCSGHKNAKKCPSGCKKATYTYKKARGNHKRGDSYTYCTPEHRAHHKKSSPKRKSHASSGTKRKAPRGKTALKTQRRGRHEYDPVGRYETYRKPGRRGDHEGLASIGYGGGYEW